MSSSYFAEYTAYLDERKRPENFPHFVQIQETYTDIENTEYLKNVVNLRVQHLATNPGLVVFKNPDEALSSSGVTFDKRRFIPWHMITHMEMRVILIPGSMKSTLDTMTTEPVEKKSGEELQN